MIESQLFKQLLAKLVEMANGNRALMDGTTGPVKLILKGNDVVYGVWQEPSSPDGVGVLIVKGRRRVEAVALSGAPPISGAAAFPVPNKMKMSAIPCYCLEQAMAVRRVLGDGD